MQTRTLTVALCPNAVGVVLHESRARPMRETVEVTAQEGAAWRGAIEGLAHWLRRRDFARARASIVLSSRFARYSLVPWPPSQLTRDEASAWARFHLESVHGDMTGWTVASDTGEFGRAHVACALPDALLQVLRETLTQREIFTVAIRPAFVSGWNAWRKQIKSGQFFGVAESGRLVLGCYGHDGWESLRALSTRDSCHDLEALALREHVLMGKAGVPDVLLFAPGATLDPTGIAANEVVGVRWLQGKANVACPALDMAMLAAEP